MSLPLIGQLAFGGLSTLTAGCKSKKADQSAYSQARIAEVESFFRDHALCRSLRHNDIDDIDKVNPEHFTADYKQEILKNGWEIPLLHIIQKEADKTGVPFLLPRVCFVVKSSDHTYLGRLTYQEKGPLISTLIVINLSQDISDINDREAFVKALIGHELNHARDYAFFRLINKKDRFGQQTALDFLTDNALKILNARGQPTSKSRLRNQFIALAKKIENYPGNTNPLAHYLSEIRAEEKSTPFAALFFFHYGLSEKYPPEGPGNKISPIELAFDLILTEKLGAEKTSTEIRQAAASLPPADKELFTQCLQVFDLQYEVSKRFIDFNTLPTTKLPPLVKF
jgi:hypothetical protein